jgi:hypothetical protein
MTFNPNNQTDGDRFDVRFSVPQIVFNRTPAGCSWRVRVETGPASDSADKHRFDPGSRTVGWTVAARYGHDPTPGWRKGLPPGSEGGIISLEP